MAKPICIIYFPDNFSSGRDNRNWIYSYMRFLNGEIVDNDKVSYGEQKDYWKDYYWFCFYKYDIDAPEFQVFHEKDFTEIQYEELRKLITDSISEIKK